MVLDDEAALAFLDVRPLFPGHTLLVPRDHHETPGRPARRRWSGRYFAAGAAPGAGHGGRARAAGSFVAINNRVSQSVPHLHVHVVPRNRKDGLRGFFWPRAAYADDAEATAVAERVRAAYEAVALPLPS